METKFKFEYMIVYYQELDSSPELSKIEFLNTLPARPLSSIKDQIYIRYKLNNDRDLNLFIKHGDSAKKWDVFDCDIPFFPFIFTSVNERKFIDVFEEQLKQKLEKQEREEHQAKFPYSSLHFDYGDAKVSMDGE